MQYFYKNLCLATEADGKTVRLTRLEAHDGVGFHAGLAHRVRVLETLRPAADKLVSWRSSSCVANRHRRSLAQQDPDHPSYALVTRAPVMT